jgi:hypothetical protein
MTKSTLPVLGVWIFFIGKIKNGDGINYTESIS